MGCLEVFRRMTGWFGGLPSVHKLSLAGLVLLLILVILSLLAFILAALLLGISVIALIIRVAQRKSIPP